MIAIKALVFIFLILGGIEAKVYAGGFVKGNGGNVIHCPKDNKILALDYYEQQVRFNLHPDQRLLSAVNFIPQIIEKIKKISTKFSQITIISAEEILNNVIFVTNSELGTIDDTYPYFIPRDCLVKQAAFQRDRYLYIDQRIWNSLSLEQRNVLIAHEIIYRSFIKLAPIKNSEPVRIFNSLILSQEINFWSDSQIKQFLNNNNIYIADKK